MEGGAPLKVESQTKLKTGDHMLIIESARASTLRLVCVLGATTLLCPVLAGCGTTSFSDRGTNPMIQDTTTMWLKPLWIKRNVDVFATTASRRTILVMEDKNDIQHRLQACAEPPPDVGEAFSEAIAAGLQGALSASQGTDTQVGATIAGQFAHETATQIAPLLYRTQGLQAMRDSQYTLCVDRMSGYISEEEYLKTKDARFNRAAQLIEDEIKVMKEAQVAFFEHWKTSGEKVDVASAVRLMEAAKSTAPPIPTLPATRQ